MLIKLNKTKQIKSEGESFVSFNCEADLLIWSFYRV